MSTTRETIQLTARDGTRLAADVLSPQGEPRASAVLAPAMGVPRRLYRGLGTFLAEAGIASVTLDYRGIGESAPPSLVGYRARLSDWAELDLPAAARAAIDRAPGRPLLWLGHSVGGQLMGLSPELPIARAVFLASQSGHWRHWSGVRRLGMWGLWHAVMPTIPRARGYFPMRLMGGGEDLPRGVAEQWAQWGRAPGYVRSYLAARDGQDTFRYEGPLRAYAFTDDAYAPRPAVEALLEAYGRSDHELRVVSPRDLGARAIGHFGALKETFRPTLWAEVRDYLTEALS